MNHDIGASISNHGFSTFLGLAISPLRLNYHWVEFRFKDNFSKYTRITKYFYFLLLTQLLQGQNVEHPRILFDEKKYHLADSFFTMALDSVEESDTLLIYEIYKKKAICQKNLGHTAQAIANWTYLVDYFSPGQKQLGDCHNALATIYNNEELFKDAVRHFELARDAYQKSHGQQDSLYTLTMNSLGWGYKRLGEYSKAEGVLKKAKLIKEQLRKEDLQYSRILTTLADVAITLNKFQDAEEYLKTAIRIKEKKALEGDKNHGLEKSLYWYAILLNEINREEEALSKIAEAIDIQTKSNKLEISSEFKQIKASILVSMGDINAAINIFEEVKKELEVSNRQERSNYGTAVYNLSDLYRDQKNYQKALFNINLAIQVFEKSHSKEHPYYAKAIKRRADILFEMGELKNIAAAYKTAGEIISKKYGKDDIEYFNVQFAYFKYLKKIGKIKEATLMLDLLDRIVTRKIKESTLFLSLKEISDLSKTYRSYFFELLSLSSSNPSNAYISRKAMDASLFYKGTFMQSALNLRKTLQEGKETQELYDKSMELRTKIKELQSGENPQKSEILHFQDSIDLIDIELSRSMGKLRKEDRQVFWSDVQTYLLDNQAAIDFLRVKPDNASEAYYIALVLRNDSVAPIPVKLFTESEFKQVIGQHPFQDESGINELYGDHQQKQKSLKSRKTLFDLIWKPIMPHLKGINNLQCSKDGDLMVIALQSIPLNSGELILDKFNYQELTSLRQITKSRHKNIQTPKGKVKLISPVDQSQLKENLGYSMNPLSRARSKKGFWESLPETEIEVKNISEIAKNNNLVVELYLRQDARKTVVEQMLMKNSDHHILHFATHGYFETENLYDIKPIHNDDPVDLDMSRSAIVLSDANLLPGKEAVLTAYEVSQLDLQNTELVVLSACETGLGQIYESEGVYGMQRAFKIAGAEYIIMSLWKVPDKETREFMVEFYTLFLSEQLSIEEAFNLTQRKMKAMYPKEPVKWAGFVLVN